MHKTIDPTILYFGTPVALISTLNPDGTPNLAPMSSAWWLGWSCMLGLGQMGQTSDNLIRSRECVINLPSEDLVGHVDRLALTTGKNPVPKKKRQWGYRYEPDKFGIAGFTPAGSESVAPPRVRECPVQMEGIVHDFRSFGKNVSANMFEVHIVKLHVDEKLLVGDGPRPHIDPVALASVDHELLPLFWLRRRGASVASDGIRFHEIRHPRDDGATSEFVYNDVSWKWRKSVTAKMIGTVLILL
jgi:flavin reductase (DIM6/NTAB) family NADH-FMN oxidoreductase RutF